MLRIGAMSSLGVGFGLALLLAAVACGKMGGHGPEAGEGGEPGDSGGAGNMSASGGTRSAAAGDGGIEAGGRTAEAGAPSAGEAGGGAGGSEAAPPVVGQDCNGNAYTLDAEHARLCVLLASCAGPSFSPIPDTFGGGLTVSSCLRQGPALTVFQFRTTPPDQPLMFDARASACAESITTCDDVLACAGFRLPIAECDDGALARCEGDLAINCGKDPSVTDCERTTGKTGSCELLGEGAEQRAACVVKAQCSEDAGTFACDGDTLYRCTEQGVGEGSDCSRFGLTCEASSAWQYGGCIQAPPNAACDAPGRAECSGNAQTFCGTDGRLYSHACGSSGELVCAEGTGDAQTDGVWMDCMPAGCETLLDDFEDCDGDDLITDFGLRLHCPDYGFATCRNLRCAD